VRASISVAPTVGDSETTLFYVKSEARAAAYYAVDDNRRAILAARMRVGMIAGEANLDLPASERFYSGGGGSVRGIGYQLAGPVDANRDPVGGRSVVEVGAEARLRVTDRIGIVPFVEGGTVFTSDVPNFAEDIHWGAGIGLRYYTAFGPIRLDVATPLNRRDKIDDVVQIYVSLGQAF
jgi:translocation and assembly module TamA